MKLPLALKFAAGAVVLGLLPACGQTGPLYLPKPPSRPAPPPTGPVGATPTTPLTLPASPTSTLPQ